ncbi:unannotated protein [freshwater metagenome]|jgi:uncharacterized HhH-GPD family protein|uniref:Unannotated protein n=1 Tax=freshwater metagenome TaxID=449393 RepID=A0A6J7FZC3_9ZZZZ|nr:Fe-S cluster assembly protein HesB [Actinomycetota bacterium]MSV40786.1 Fe-S cluster assembly protein HesB [Actinomycetota bacterium]MSV94176.1 Fe-S cluster assembly protein HesB [Actinomycetota bacterium]MSW60604.1 Fe-S cluster assembly protein HesB [Actinomycetota bacterium]MSY44048.1 Fe-S cluster assembly protein HesB [Actinomycetota bacterium]
MANKKIAITGIPAADRLLVSSPLALFIGMLLDQQIPMEWAFRGPYVLRDRLGGLNAKDIAEMSPSAIEKAFSTKPALHRFPGSMAKRTQALCQALVDDYSGRAATVWTTARTGEELLARLEALPGFGTEKAKIFIALLGKRLGVAPPGWKAVAKPFSDSEMRSVADIYSPETLEAVRAWKKAQKARGKSKAE